MSDNTDPKNRLREEAIEPRDPFIVLAQRVWPLVCGKSPTRAPSARARRIAESNSVVAAVVLMERPAETCDM